jgi:cbb3-type cytochrome oxidase subunit 3
MLHPIIYHALLIAVCAYAFLRGRRDERFAASICLLATLATRLALSPVTSRYSGVETGVFLVDLLTLGGFTFIALRTDRFWPLWVAGIQLTTMLAHGLKAIELNLIPEAYAAAARFWVYPIFLIIFIGTWRSHQRAVQRSVPATRSS